MEKRLTKLQAMLEADAALLEKLFSLESPAEVQGLLQEQGLEFSLEEIDVLREGLVKVLEKGASDELSDADLEDVAGGSITAAVAIIGAIAGLIGAAAGAVDKGVRSRW